MQEFWKKKLTKTGIFTHFSHSVPIQKEAPSQGRFQKFTILLLLCFSLGAKRDQINAYASQLCMTGL